VPPETAERHTTCAKPVSLAGRGNMMEPKDRPTALRGVACSSLTAFRLVMNFFANLFLS